MGIKEDTVSGVWVWIQMGKWVWDTRVMGIGSRGRKRNNTTTKRVIQY